MVSRTSGSKSPRSRRPPATTPEERENQLVAQAMDLAERQIQEGKASATVITHFLKLGSARESLERKKLEQENELLRARVESLASMQRVEELYSNALKAMRIYSGQDESEDGDEFD